MNNLDTTTPPVYSERHYVTDHHIPVQVRVEWDQNRPEHHRLVQELNDLFSKYNLRHWDPTVTASYVRNFKEQQREQEHKLELARQRIRELRAQK